MNFGTATQPTARQSITLAPGATIIIDLQWDQPFSSIGTGHASANSLGLAIYDASDAMVASAMADHTGGDPVQVVRYTNTSASSDFHLAIVSNGSSAPPYRFKYIAYGTGITINDPKSGIGSGTVIGHALSNDSICVGAIAATNAPTLGGNGLPEPFTATGPGTVLFDAEGNRIAAPFLGYKVDVIAPDAVPTSVFTPFFGTSAAAPVAAGVAALMLQANPALTPQAVMLDMEQTARPLAGDPDTWGAGLIQAPLAVSAAIAQHGAPPPAGFGFAVPNPDAPGWVVIDVEQSGVNAMHETLGALAADPTAMQDLAPALAGAPLGPDPAQAIQSGAAGGITLPYSSDLACMPDWEPHIMA